MGIYVDYTLRAECLEEELRERLETVRRRCMDLPLKAVGDVLRVEPVYNSITIMLYESEGLTLPEAIAERVQASDADRDHRIRSLSFAPMMNPDLPKEELARYYAPALEFIARTDLWNKAEIPERLGQTTPFGFSPITLSRRGIEFDFANIMLRYGYVLFLHPGEGSESINLALGNLREEGVPVHVLEDNASKAKPVDFSAALAREEEAEASESRQTPESG